MTTGDDGRPAARPRTDGAAVPPGPVDGAIVDCHVHVFDPGFPFAADRTYTPGPATVADLRAFLAGLGVARAVLVQPSVYGDDNACLVAALAALGPAVARGIAVIDPATVPDDALTALARAGVVGVRVNLHTRGQDGIQDRGRAAVAAVAETIGRVAPLGFAVQLFVDLALVPALADTIAAAPVPVVLDHFAGARAAAGPGQPGLDVLLDLLAAGRVWIKLSGVYRAGREAPDYPDLAPLARRLIAANPDRLVWASDWPHTGGGAERAGRAATDIEPFRTVDDHRALAVLAEWAGDATTTKKILVDNPTRLFRF
ncbi:amidohydrolase family protein [Rhodoplanes sp. TEM]|uniref:Amidohydrolase family protein n=1 Tax=Rhodoplanes tepidamans TaxID=200616 RepID=A0ABT5J6Z1_RHOTP|nr:MULTISPECIES: amidohydrolase family protein [Rhodoplanes]MDC7785430.1 amidohydrolase family protein [Rhodoplanes tepidamans]MDC7985789.1 amidohydrolase family protein [Rhodoplanes sp. TEM]MDQ0353116.1 putative TIM-barrel fold metal-dependent hydrolase [Rhodoplanes tepidamans]